MIAYFIPSSLFSKVHKFVYYSNLPRSFDCVSIFTYGSIIHLLSKIGEWRIVVVFWVPASDFGKKIKTFVLLLPNKLLVTVLGLTWHNLAAVGVYAKAGVVGFVCSETH